MRSPAQAGEPRRLQEHVVLGACLLALKPLHVAFQPPVLVAFAGKGANVRHGVQPNHALQPFEGPLPQETLLPVACPLLGMRTIPQATSCLPALVWLTASSASCAEQLLRSSTTFAWRSRTSSTIWWTLCSECMLSFLLRELGSRGIVRPLWEMTHHANELDLY